MRMIAAGLILLSLINCKTKKEVVETKAVLEHPSSILVTDFSEYQNSASLTITAVLIEKNTMKISVSYSGGCEKHEFKLVGSKLIQKSLPPKRGVMLFHNNNGDSCRSIVEEDLLFDISNLAYDGKEIMLILEGWASPVSYKPLIN